ncbi:MAG TPA: sulfatase [Bacteroides sp.]|nr:sulfatase [Bacteroides sp.]
MTRLPVVITILLLLVFLTDCKNNGNKTVPGMEARRPNIIFILTDDQRWDALGYAGNDIIHTPNMDKLAGEGLFFRNAFVTTPICAASRASLFTGLYERTHNYTFGKPNLDDRYMYRSYPYLLRNAGYRTGFVGKFGVKVNEDILDSLFDSKELTWYPYFVDVEGEQVHLADINGNHAIDFIKSGKEKPFCLSLSFWSPHANDGEEQQYFWPEYCDSLYADTHIPVPETADPAFFEALPEFLKTTMNRKRWYWRYDTPEKHQAMVKGYYRMISGVDSVLGRIQTALEEEGLADNTVIILMGDNGYFLGERGYAGKWLMHEPSLRVPLIIHDPRQPDSKRSRKLDEMVLNLDITPTILELAGVDIPESYHGESLGAFINGIPESWRSSIFCEHRLENNALLLKTECFRDDTWKFIRYEDEPGLIELYNHREDPQETNNLALGGGYENMLKNYHHVCDSISERLMSERILENP